jgi:hypothetical protein
MNQDEEHLRLLSIFHYIVGGLTALCACFPLIHLAIGLMMLFAPEKFSNAEHAPGPDRLIGLFFTLFAGAFILLGWALAAATIYAGRCLTMRENYTFCLIVAAVSCINTPIGTVLGVFTIIVLMRPSVKQMFEAKRTAQDSLGVEVQSPD